LTRDLVGPAAQVNTVFELFMSARPFFFERLSVILRV